MKPNRPAGCDAELLRSGYEQLRRDALGGSVNEYMRGKGFALVLRHGMFAWILAWSECADAHEGYISWQEYESNQRRLLENAQAHGIDRRKSPPREGSALLQGMILCGTCGRRMTVHYHRNKQKIIPYYLCQREGIEHGELICQSTNGEGVDKALSKLVIDSFTPLALEVALTVQDELKARFDEADLLRRKHVERIQYETDLARRRYMQVDPENRLVADTLEGEWNKKLRMLKDAQEEYERQRKQDLKVVGVEAREKILALATDFPRLWNDAGTQCREKKRMLRLLIEDVTLTRNGDRTIGVDVRFKGGAAKSLHLPAPVRAWELNRTSKALIDRIDTMLNEHTDAEIADTLISEGKISATGLMFSPIIVGTIRRRAGLKSRYERLREQNLLDPTRDSDEAQHIDKDGPGGGSRQPGLLLKGTVYLQIFAVTQSS